MLKVAVIGAAGYTGIEVVRWVLGHPRLELVAATSAAEAGTKVGGLYPALAPLTDVEFTAPDMHAVARVADAALLAVPHTAAMAIVPGLLEAGVTVIDLSADFRLRDASVYERWYGVSHEAGDLLQRAVYGLPELDRSGLAGAGLVACPGCYPTASLLAALPAIRSKAWTGSPVRIDAKSGVSGAGRAPAPGTHFVAANEALRPYSVGTHRHTPEIEQAISQAGEREARVIFTPHLVPMSRGLLATVYLDVEPGYTTADALEEYTECYSGEPFVSVVDPPGMPSTGHVRGTNRAAVGVHVDERTSTLVAVCAIDNLGKGAAGQAIQCLNAVAGFPETEGLDVMAPVI